MENPFKPIDLREVIASKNPALARRIPGFILKLFAQYLHLEQINAFLAGCTGEESGVELCERWLNFLEVKANVRFIDKEALQSGRRFIFVSNHPLGGIDGIFLIQILGSFFPSIKFIVNDFLTFIPPLKPLFIPVNKMGAMKREYLQQFEQAFESQAQILCFPAGLCSRLSNGKITDLQWHSSFVKHALKYNRDIVPVYFSGRNSMLFYRIARLRKLLGVKFNVEMTMLPGEMFRKKSANFDIIIGAPVSLDSVKSGIEECSGHGMASKVAFDHVCCLIREMSYSLERFCNAKEKRLI